MTAAGNVPRVAARGRLGVTAGFMAAFGASLGNPNYDPAGPVPDDTVYFTKQTWYDE